jgi:hypothetical protein
MNFKLALSSLLLGASFLSVPACAVDSSDAASDEDSEGANEEAAATQDELTANASRLAGAFHGANNGAGLPPTFDGLVLQQNGEFFADVDTGIRCITAPCPSNVRLVGRFSATRNYLSLSPKSGERAHSFHGRYRYTLTGEKLSLTRTGAQWRSWSNKMAKELSYCSEATDCGGQALIHPMCVGGWTCGEQRSCGWKCGVIPPVANAVWPSDRTNLVAETAGGGFTPPPPAGSQCAIGAQKYSLDLATKKLAYETCKFVDWNTPLTKQSGNKTLTAAQMAKVDAAMQTIKISNNDICGADKPFLSISVTSTSKGTQKFADEFYSCMDTPGQKYVDNIDAIFSAFRDIVGQ